MTTTRTSAADRFFIDLINGKRIRATVVEQSYYGVNQIPDLARKLKKKGLPIKNASPRVLTPTGWREVAEYYFEKKFISQYKKEQKKDRLKKVA